MNTIVAEKITTEAALQAVHGIIDTVINLLEGAEDERIIIAREALEHAADIAVNSPLISTALKDEVFRTLQGRAEKRDLHITQNNHIQYTVKDSADRVISTFITIHQLEDWFEEREQNATR